MMKCRLRSVSHFDAHREVWAVAKEGERDILNAEILVLRGLTHSHGVLFRSAHHEVACFVFLCWRISTARLKHQFPSQKIET
jgi:hypothetical protein